MYSAVLSEDIPYGIFAVKGGRPAVLRRQGENMKKNIGKIQVLK